MRRNYFLLVYETDGGRRTDMCLIGLLEPKTMFALDIVVVDVPQAVFFSLQVDPGRSGLRSLDPC